MPFEIASLREEREEVDARVAGLDRTLVTDILGCRTTRDVRAPQVFYVGQIDPGSSIRPHFHGVDQFQLVVGGTGLLGKHAVKAGSFHYADAYQPYGPITAGPAGLAYLTIRMRHDSGVHYMPGSGHLRKQPAKRRPILGEIDPLSPPAGAVVSPDEDGLQVSCEHIAGEGTLRLRAPRTSDGQIGVVLGGDLIHGGTKYPALSCLATSPDEEVELEAGADGATLLVFQFPTAD